MSISVQQVSPYDTQKLVTLDSKIEITFSGAIDPFTVLNGVSIFHNIPPNWNGESASMLDKPSSDISEVGQQYSFVTYDYTLVGNKLVITPDKGLQQDLEYTIQIVPGNDATRFLSQSTTGSVSYSRVASSNGTINITSAYTGKVDTVYSLEFGLTNNFDYSIGGVFKGSVTYQRDIPVKIGDLTISLNGTFDIGDTITIPAFQAVGLTGVFKSKFTTSKYEALQATTSSKIEDQLLKLNVNTLKIASSIPGCLSINNKICNPIIIKFNKPISQTQDLSQCINIYKTNIETGASKRITYYYKFLGTDSIKVYLVGLDHTASVSDLPIYNPSEQYRMQDFYKLPTYKSDGTLENSEISGLGI